MNLALQDNVLLPEGFTEYIYHVGIGKEMRSMVKHGLIPGGVSLKTGRQAEFFTVVNPMDHQDGLGETNCDLSQATIAPSKNSWKRFQNTVLWCNMELASSEKASNFTKLGHMLVISLQHTTCEFALRKRYV